MNHTLKLFNTGQITLPKSWRTKYNTKSFLAEETDKGLLIKPIMDDDVVYYENKEGFGIYSESGIDPLDIIYKIKKLQNG
ncbi:hypothetical protein EOM39_01405 [Candidatus Gracilibacteria bacterium]|nr:hypothetical protein [Candidatus Gracilibacteria bacterium]